MIHLKSITVRKFENEHRDFPFNVPTIQTLKEVEFTAPVTFLVGENGSGKSTLLEALACAVGSTTVCAESVKTDDSLVEIRKLAQQMRLSWSKRTQKGFFLRAEDFFGYIKNLARMRQELEQDIQAVDQTYKGRSKLAADLAKSPHQNELQTLKKYYGEKGLEAYSHGESFLTLFQSRFVAGGLYLLDEPEAPLSPIRQLAFLATLKHMVREDAQFIIATHSPILMAFQPSVILSFDHARIEAVQYHDLEQVKLMKDFLNNPQAYLNQL